MDKKVYKVLANLAKDSTKRDDESMQDLAEMLTAEGHNELKSLFSQWLEDHPESVEPVSEDADAGEDTMVLNDHDTRLLKNLMS